MKIATDLFKFQGMKIKRSKQQKTIERLLRRFSVVALLGARQVGKSTIARDFINSQTRKSSFFDLEDERDLARLQQPMLALEPLRGIVVLDEAQNLPDIIHLLGANSDECYFWATHAGAELDLLTVRGKQRLGFEFKRTDAPRITASMQ